MASLAINDEDLSFSISSNTRRGTNMPQDGGDDNQTAQPPPPSRTDTTSSTQRANQRLGQYRVIQTLGEGSFGKVKLAEHQITGQKVALKIISRRKLVTRDMAGRIEREISYLQLLRHPHIIKLFTVITTNTEIIMVLEYAKGELFDYIVQNGRLPEDKARRFFQQIICAVEYCHRHKIVHRDLKPENLLLDEDLNVKIADFGLSNIMSDGNFLRTSCGSPNYAAPEVISGKLYAGPEVDVWSCGVILYVLLVGRLPFDDEYIPALFKKIAQGNYMIPNYLSPGAVSLIKRMLVVNPNNRIVMQDIRQDPWFNKDLAEYLRLPAEEFYNTGVDPDKAIHIRDSGQMVQLHETAIGKLGKTMGYNKDDVKDALSKNEPSAIKDAYLIVRENLIMKENAMMAKDNALLPYLAQSPPTFDPKLGSSHIPPLTARPTSIHPTIQDSQRQSSSPTTTPLSTIAVLPSSLPDYHRAYMKGHPKNAQSPEPSGLNDLVPPQQQSREQQAATARRLKPHSRSQIGMDKLGAKPDALTPLPVKKARPTKWQFGIRSRNAPAEAMLAIYKALRAMGADWEAPRIRRPGGGSYEESPNNDHTHSRSRSRSYSGSRSNSRSSSTSDDRNFNYSRTPSPGSRTHSPRHSLTVHNPDTTSHNSLAPNHSRGRSRSRRRHGPQDDWGYSIPEDPWVINARFRKDGMFPPGVTHPSSAHSSIVNLQDAGLKRDVSGPTSPVVSPSTGTELDEGTRHSSRNSEPDGSVYVYVTIQLYNIENGMFVVDFKCAAYERLVHQLVKEVRTTLAGPGSGNDSGWRKIDDDNDITETEIGEGKARIREVETGVGRVEDEKKATSPFPFLDVASRLIITLAEGA